MRGRFTWTEQQIELLKVAYSLNQGKRNGWLKKLSQEIGHGMPSCVVKAKSLGILIDRNRSLVVRQREREPRIPADRSAIQKLNILLRGHPKGMLGKHHTQTVRIQMSNAHLGIPHPHSEATKINMSLSAQRRLQEKPESNTRAARPGKGGRRADLDNRYFRSTYEANYARFLNFTKVKWEYESKTFWFDKITRGNRSYTPDFYLPATDEYHEVKGWMDEQSVTKLTRMARYFPDVKIVVIDGTFFASANRKGLCRLIPGWECNHVAHQHKTEDV